MGRRSAALVGAMVCAGGWADPPKRTGGEPIVVKMEDCQAKRPGTLRSDTNTLKMIFSGISKEELVKRGTVEIDGSKCVLYLPKTKPYTTTNSKTNDSSLENTSTLISVDQVGKGELTHEDGWFANLPIRLGDKMFEVAEIATDGSRIVLKPSRGPLHGVIVGRRCPPFSFKTAEGKEIMRETLSGKAVILDIWSIT